MKKPEKRKIRILNVIGAGHTRKGNPWLECESAQGQIVAFWGPKTYSPKKILYMIFPYLNNISRMKKMSMPVTVQCGCISSNWSQHNLWVPESAWIKVVRDSA